MKKETVLLGISLLLFSLLGLEAESLLRLGGDGFRSIKHSEGIRLQSLPEGKVELILRDLQFPANPDRDLYLSFDQPPLQDLSSNWRVQESRVRIVDTQRARGSGAGAFFSDSKLSLFPVNDTFLSAGLLEGGFTFQFWLYPATLGEGEGIFVYRKPESRGEGYQEISCRISSRRLVWSFVNIFQGPRGQRIDVTLTGSTPLIPREWRHHTLRYDASTGMIEYLLDGEPDAIIYATPSGREESTAYYPNPRKNPFLPFVIGEGFQGFLDEFIVYRKYLDTLQLLRYPKEGGWFETEPLDLGTHNARFVKLTAQQVLPSNSAVFYYYRISNTLGELGRIDWIPLEPGKDQETRAQGRYLQLRGELYPDGSRSLSPRISDMLISYKPKDPPPPPMYVQAIPGDGEVLLRWSKVADPSVEGYYVYYGDEPGIYRGNDSSLGPSPIKVGKQ
ncbi:MAG: LamG-like jellyroll fold domain-containing protein, partial [Spirochaetales bacterium]